MKKRIVSRSLLTLLLISIFTLAFNVKPVRASGTIYIRPDGSVEGTDKIERDGDVYTFIDNIYDGIFVERDNIVVDGAGYTVSGRRDSPYTEGLHLARRKNVTIRNMSIEGFYYGVLLGASSNNSIADNNLTNNEYGIRLDYSSNIGMFRNNITANNGGGIWLFHSSNSRVYENNVTVNDLGILLAESSDNSVSGNNVTNNSQGVILSDSSTNTVCGNIITGNGYGIPIVCSSGNVVFGNDLAKNRDGIHLHRSSGNLIYHNNFLNNTRQVSDVAWIHLHLEPSRNTWDWGYPSGGNYWSNYSGVDKKSGTNQDRHGSDGVGDTPYVIDENNQDNYPLIRPFPSPLDSTRGLIETIEIWSLPKGTENRLTSKLHNAVHLLNMGNENGAIQNLMNFIHEVDKLRGNELTHGQAIYLMSETQRIIGIL